MLFQILSATQGIGVLETGQFINSMPESGQTWDFHPGMTQAVDIARIFCNAKNLEKVLDSQDWIQYNKFVQYKRLIKEIRSRIGSIEKEELDIYFYSKSKLLDYSRMLNTVCQRVFNSYDKPKNYEQILRICEFVSEMNRNVLNIDWKQISSVKNASKRARLIRSKGEIRFDPIGSVTGRLRDVNDGFPILSLKEEHRRIILPSQDFLIELDFNALDLRSFLALANMEQPTIDCHEWNAKHLLNVGRDEAKIVFFSWLFGSSHISPTHQRVLERHYKKDEVISKHFDGEYVENPYGRRIKSDDHHLLSYLVQSTSHDIFFEQLLAVDSFLKSQQAASKILFTMHDAFVVDVNREEEHLLPAIKKIFQTTRFGMFPTKMTKGLNYGQMANNWE